MPASLSTLPAHRASAGHPSRFSFRAGVGPAVPGNIDLTILKSDTSTVASMYRYTAASRKYFSTPTSSDPGGSAGGEAVQQQAGQQERREAVECEGALQAVGGDVPVDPEPADVVDQHVQAQVGVSHLGGQTAHLGLGGHVGGKDIHGCVARCGAAVVCRTGHSLMTAHVAGHRTPGGLRPRRRSQEPRPHGPGQLILAVMSACCWGLGHGLPLRRGNCSCPRLTLDRSALARPEKWDQSPGHGAAGLRPRPCHQRPSGYPAD